MKTEKSGKSYITFLKNVYEEKQLNNYYKKEGREAP